MKILGIKRKSIVGILLSLVILAALLGSAIPVSADGWTLTLVGSNSTYFTQAAFEEMAAAQPSTIITDGGTQYKGVALWRLIALVDDGDPETLNSTLASGISVQAYSTPSYGTALTSTQWYGTDGANKENVIAANKYFDTSDSTWKELVSSRYPIKITGTVGGTLMTGSNRPNQVTTIRLIGLPNDTVNISPASTTANVGNTFSVDVLVNTATASRGWSTEINFDATKLTAISVSEGGFLKDWAAVNKDASNNPGSTTSVGSAAIDNTGGHITNINYGILGGTTGAGPTGAGILCTISFTASASGTASIAPTSVSIRDVNGDTISVTVNGGQVNVASLPPATYALTMAASPTAAGAATDTTNTGPYTAGTIVNIHAAANSGYEFDHWTSNTGGSFGATDQETTTFTMPSSVATVTANFTAMSQPPSGNAGSLTVSGTIATATVAIQAPSSVTGWAPSWSGPFNPVFGPGANYGSSTPGTVTVTPGSDGVTDWIVTAAATPNYGGKLYNAQNGMFLIDQLMIGPDGSVGQGDWNGSSTWNNANTGITFSGSNASGSLPFYAEQTIERNDSTAGDYSIVITFAAQCSP